MNVQDSELTKVEKLMGDNGLDRQIFVKKVFNECTNLDGDLRGTNYFLLNLMLATVFKGDKHQR